MKNHFFISLRLALVLSASTFSLIYPQAQDSSVESNTYQFYNSFSKTDIQIDTAEATFFILLGDAGKPDPIQNSALQKLIAPFKPYNATALFLGDNIYPNGMAGGNDSHGREVMQQLVEPFEDYSGRIYFVPGNHDYHKIWKPSGNKRIKAQANWVNARKKEFKKTKELALLPDPIEKKGKKAESRVIDDNTGLIILDTEWYLNKKWWFDYRRTFDRFENALSDQLQSLNERGIENVIVAAHHPLNSIAKHGVHHSPFQKQHLSHKRYRKMRDKLNVILNSSGIENIIYVAGHDHTQQIISETGFVQVISGGVSKNTYLFSPDTKNEEILAYIHQPEPLVNDLPYKQRSQARYALNNLKYAANQRGMIILALYYDQLYFSAYGFQSGISQPFILLSQGRIF
ncbi:MAG TPA: hypothetical protein DDY13_04230 [Cytophagales bacterium]|jgi:hypothetical protein|nr:hypothetical protein [Cytophagales bacterium]